MVVNVWVYILKCSDGTFYTGITKNLPRRMNEHALGAGGRYTRGRRPLKLIYLEQHGSYSLAMRREKELKKASPKHKQELLVCGRCGQKKPLKYSKLIASLNREQL